jgi:hypothetical protein
MDSLKTCRITGTSCVISEEDQILLDRIGVPAPDLCPRELWQNLLAYRNEWNMFARTCSKTGQNIISVYRPDTVFPVYNNTLWWSDDWSPYDY